MLGLAACQETTRSAGQPAMYVDLGQSGAVLDAGQARAIISAYRLNAGLAALTLDPALTEAARREAASMASADRPASAEAVKARLRAAGVSGPEVNLSAGYRTLAEAFSGWRDSAQHDRVMKASRATRMGIAVAQAPGSKYQVYWALILSD
jgi:uncharacterized protein YkwD